MVYVLQRSVFRTCSVVWKRPFWENSEQFKVVNYFCRDLRLGCFTEFLMPLCFAPSASQPRLFLIQFLALFSILCIGNFFYYYFIACIWKPVRRLRWNYSRKFKRSPSLMFDWVLDTHLRWFILGNLKGVFLIQLCSILLFYLAPKEFFNYYFIIFKCFFWIYSLSFFCFLINLAT